MKKESVLKYFPIIRRKNNRVRGTLILMLQSRLKEKKLFNFFNKWERKLLILWRPDLQTYPNLISYPGIKDTDWVILEKYFTTFSEENIKIKHVCKNKRLLKELIKY
jgi:hypothetical protein